MRAIFIDAHGVLLDFVGGLAFWMQQGIPEGVADFWSHHGFPDEPSFWKALNVYSFWRDLPKLEGGIGVLAAAQKIARQFEVPWYVITRPMLHSIHAIGGTVDLLVTDLKVPFENIVITTDKGVCAHDGFLVDDEQRNCDRWRSLGGTAYLWPAHWNSYLGMEHCDFAIVAAECVAEMHLWARYGNLSKAARREVGA